MTIYKTNELTGDLLNHASAMASGYSRYDSELKLAKKNGDVLLYPFNPVEDWSQCGQLIEKFKIDVAWFKTSKKWACNSASQLVGNTSHEDLKTAICRCVVQSVLGNEVEL